MELAKFKIHLGATKGTIEMDGKPLTTVRSLVVKCGGGEVTTVTIEFVADDVDLTYDKVKVVERKELVES